MKSALCFLGIAISISSFSQFSDPIVVTNPPASQNEMFVMDIEGDGDLDILTTNGGFVEFAYYNSMGSMATEFRISINDGFGVFIEQPLILLSTPSFWSFGDVDMDGKMDFVYSDTQDVYYMHNSTGLSFELPVLVFETTPVLDCSLLEDYEMVPAAIRRVGIGDVDNDGDGDLVITSQDNFCADGEMYWNSANRIYTMQWDGNTFGNFTFIDEAFFISASTNAGGIQVTDVNADGHNDIIFLSGPDISNWELIIYYGTGNVLEFNAWSLAAWDEILFGQMDGDEALEAVGLNLWFGPNLIWEEIDLVDSQNLFMNTSVAYSPNDISSARIAILDVYNDGLPDVVLHSHTGELHLNINENGSYPFSSVFISTGIEDYTNLRSGDMNGDGGEDVLIMNEGNVFILFGQTGSNPLANVTATVFYDSNGDGTMNNAEQGLANQQITLDNGLYLFTNQDGDASTVLTEGNYTLSAEVDQNIYAFSTDNLAALEITPASSDTVIYFGVIPAGDPIDSLSLQLSSTVLICNSYASHYITIHNTGNTWANGTVVFELDPMMEYQGAMPPPATYSGNTITWLIDNIQPMGFFSATVFSTSPDVLQIGNTYMNSITATLIDDQENVLFASTFMNTEIVTCSYDPNDITEHNGYTDQGFVLDGDELEYTIRFQNTGNAPAVNVRIENQLSDLLNRSTLQPIAWSHNFDLVIDETGKAIFSFSNINLPDSISNEPESHGFVTYRILPVTGLAPMTVIENTAEIYFDFNPAVVTNTEINTIYDCDDLSQTTIGATEACAGEIIAASNNAQWVEDVWWDYNEQIQSGVSIDLPLQETAVLSMTASNSLCTYEQQWTLNVISTEASFVVNGNVLTVNDGENYQWYLNGMPIENATQQTYEISQTGSYQVMVTNAEGCAEISESTQVTYTGIPVFSLSESYLYPNPMRDQATLVLPEGTWVVSVTDSHGKVLKRYLNCTGNFVLRREDLAIGTYCIQIQNGLISEIYQLILH